MHCCECHCAEKVCPLQAIETDCRVQEVEPHGHFETRWSHIRSASEHTIYTILAASVSIAIHTILSIYSYMHAYLRIYRYAHVCVCLRCRRLPEDFPVSAPFVAVSVTGLSHPWIESDGRVRGHPHLTNWNSHCVLGNIIRNVVSEFMAHPPRPSSMVQQQPPSNAADSSVSSSTRSPSQQPQQAQSGQDSNQPNRIALPPIPSKFEDLEALR